MCNTKSAFVVPRSTPISNSSEEEQLVFSIDGLQDDNSQKGHAGFNEVKADEKYAKAVAAVWMPGEVQQMLIEYVSKAISSGSEQDLHQLASQVAALGYPTVVRSSLGARRLEKSVSQLRHSFVATTFAPGTEVIIDPKFRSQFEFPSASPAYQLFLNHIPAVFVGSATHLKQLLRLIASEMASEYVKMGMSIPPWRSLSALESKWLSLHVENQAVQKPTGASPIASPVISTLSASSSPATSRRSSEADSVSNFGSSPEVAGIVEISLGKATSKKVAHMPVPVYGFEVGTAPAPSAMKFCSLENLLPPMYVVQPSRNVIVKC